MCLSRASTAAANFSSINDAFVANDVSWNNCVSLGVDNTSVNVGKHHSLFVEAKKLNPHIMLMGCPCHIAHNTAAKATDALENCVNGFDIKELLVDRYFHFDYSSKRKNLLVEFCQFCDQEYRKIIKFHSVRWLGLSTCIGRILLMFPSLQSYFLSQNLEMRDGERTTSRLNRLIEAFKKTLTEVLLFFT